LDGSQIAEAEKTKAALKKMEGDMGEQLASLDLKKEVQTHPLTHSPLFFYTIYDHVCAHRNFKFYLLKAFVKFEIILQEIMARFNEFSGKSLQTLADLELKSQESVKTNSASIEKLAAETETKISQINGNLRENITTAVAEEIEKVSKPLFMKGLNKFDS
jgi:hypothetical protein